MVSKKPLATERKRLPCRSAAGPAPLFQIEASLPLGFGLKTLVCRRFRAVVADHPTGVGFDVAMGSPTGIDDTLGEQPGGALFVLFRVEDDSAVEIGFLAGAGKGGLDADGSAELLIAVDQIEGVDALMIIPRPIFAHGDDVDDAVRPYVPVDDGGELAPIHKAET